MKKFLIAFSGWFLIFGGCGCIKKVTYADKGLTKITDRGNITVVGVATDQLRRTAIRDDTGVYYVMKDIRGGWPKKAEGKRIKAQGKLFVVDRTELMKKTKFFQGGPAVMYILEDANWEIIE